MKSGQIFIDELFPKSNLEPIVIVFLHFSLLVELHCQVWSRLCKAGATGTEQGEDAAEDGGIWLD